MNELPREIREGNSRVWEKRKQHKLKNQEEDTKVVVKKVVSESRQKPDKNLGNRAEGLERMESH